MDSETRILLGRHYIQQRGNISEHGTDSICSMFQVQPGDRPTIDQLEASPWMANICQMASTRKTQATELMKNYQRCVELIKHIKKLKFDLDGQKSN